MTLFKVAVVVFFAASCAAKAPRAANTANSCPCPKDIMCTEDFRFVTLTVADETRKPIVLDRYETVRASNNAVLARKDNTTMGAGTYVVASDGEREGISACGEIFFFRGYRGGKKVIEEEFTLRNDCCHVERQSGRTEVVL